MRRHSSFRVLLVAFIVGATALVSQAPSVATGDGLDTQGVFRGAQWFLSDGGQFWYGLHDDVPVVGDWNGDGIDSQGVFRRSNSTWYLADVAGGPAVLQFTYGWSSATPVVGDWNGDGKDTVGVFSNGNWYLCDCFGGPATYQFGYGWAGVTPVVGDWNGDEKDTVGVFSNGNWYLCDCLGGSATYQFAYGWQGVTPLVGDWNGDGRDTVGVHWNPEARWYLCDCFGGPATYQFVYGLANDIPLAGDWDRPNTPPPPDPTLFNEDAERYSDTGETSMPTWAKYAPAVRFHRNEGYFPARATQFFIWNSSLRWSRHELDDVPIACMPARRADCGGALETIRPLRLSGRSAAGPYSFSGWYSWQLTRPYQEGRPSGLQQRDGYFLDLDNSRDGESGDLSAGERGNLANVPVYYEYLKDRYVIYWFFYAYNDGPGNFNHEGDWERIVIRLRSGDIPTEIAFDRHGCDPPFITPWSRSSPYLEWVGNHVVVYAARGRHGSYANVGNGYKSHCHSQWIGDDQVSTGGVEWRTWRTMAAVNRQPWYAFGGAWGEVGFPITNFPSSLNGHTTGPLGPFPGQKPVPPGW